MVPLRLVQANHTLLVFLIAANSEILVLNVPMASYAAFIQDLPAILSLIETKTRKIFVPTSLSHSPVKPKEWFIIVLRTSENVQSLPSTSWISKNIQTLCKKFVTKTIKLDARFDPRQFSTKLDMQLKQFYKSEQLNLIGGFQDNQKQLNLLMYK